LALPPSIHLPPLGRPNSSSKRTGGKAPPAA
jgi:hypothetical protein